MVLCGAPQSGKTTFWRRLADKNFKIEPNAKSPSTVAVDSHYISVEEKKMQESDQEPHVQESNQEPHTQTKIV